VRQAYIKQSVILNYPLSSVEQGSSRTGTLFPFFFIQRHATEESRYSHLNKSFQ